MKRDPVRIKDTRAWLIRAAKDLRSAEHGLTASPPLLEDVLFHCQQTAEKALKAFLTWHDIPFRWTHSLEEIGQQCVSIDATLKGLIDRAVPLTEYAWKFRYPAEIEEVTEEEVKQALQTARTVYDTVLARLPKEVHL
jgi:HEPN domain-containing protein